MMVSIIVLAKQMGLRYVDPHHLDRLSSDGEPVAEDYDQNPVIAQIAQAVFNDFPPGFYFVVTVTGDHPGAGGQHRVQRLPGAGLDPGQGRLRAARARARAATGSPTATASCSSR